MARSNRKSSSKKGSSRKKSNRKSSGRKGSNRKGSNRKGSSRKLSYNEHKAKYERCVKAVKAKQSTWCKNQGYPAYKIDPNKKSCYNPWQICTKTVGRPSKTSSKKSNKKSSKSSSKKYSDRKYKKLINGRERTIYIGPKGGRYYISKSEKIYI